MTDLITTVLTSLLSYVLLYKYAAIFVITFLSALIVPLPSNTSILAAASFADQGFFNIGLVFLAALAGNVMGDLTSYLIARTYGREVLEKIGPTKKLLHSQHFQRTEQRLTKYAPLTIFATRFSSALGPITNIVSGVLVIPFGTFFLWEFLGEFVNAIIFCSVGYFIGVEGEGITDIAAFVVFASALTWLTVVVAKKYFASRRSS